jgi:signal transduction histidine kinase/CheY-like chemotaxis protein/HPt (histidine-containing phosphotransfer) domain-containing protein
MKRLNKLPLKRKLLLLGVLPAAAVAIVLAIYFTLSRLDDMYTLVDKTNESLARSIAEASTSSVYSGNKIAIQSLLNPLKSEPDIIEIRVIDALGNLLSKVTNDTLLPNSLLNPSKQITQEIRLSTFTEGSDFDNLFIGPASTTESIIGYVIISLSYDSIQSRQQAVLLNSLYITLFLLITIGIITIFVSRAIGKPILGLADNIEKIAYGDYTIAPFETEGTDEISTLSAGIQSMATDIKQHRYTLEQKVIEATRELQHKNDKLNSANNKIIKSAAAKTRFISHISHEIRTPLNGIIGFLEIIQKTPLNNEQVKLVNASHLSSKNLHTIINEVLDLAQLEAGKVVINKVNFDVQQVIQDTLLILSQQTVDNNVVIQYKQDDETPHFINQDPVKFGQILMNLISNAIKFSPNSTVTISSKVHKAHKNHIEICVSDQGIGIGKNDLESLFSEFSQLDTSRRNEGSGLGLAITKHIVDALGGAISVTSVLGKGSKFCFSIPFQHVNDSYDVINKFASPDHPSVDLSKTRILVADDNEINRLLLSNLLEKQGAEITSAEDGQQVIDKTSREHFDLMLLDLRMPIKMGDEALNEIRLDSHNPNHTTPAIAITAHITSGEERAHHISSFDGYLVKPIDQSKFFALIETLLSEHDFVAKPFVDKDTKEKFARQRRSFDYEMAKISLNAEPDFMRIILQKFFAELPTQRDDISKHITCKKLLEAAEVVHKVHGSAAYCGTPVLKKIAKQLETSLRENDVANINSLLQEFTKEIDGLLSLKSQIISTVKRTP